MDGLERKVTMVDKIVVGFDESFAGARALRWAINEARMRDVLLEIVYVWQPGIEGGASDTNLNWGELEHAAREDVQSWFDEVIDAEGPGCRVELSVVSGTAGPTLVDAARDALLLVVGTRSHSSLGRVFHGSVSHYALTHSQVPVVAVPADEDETR
ncbi:universal stress protein [Streptomyces sp. NPDC102437]|uniref:universal stress protein n=1 Tax=Streptomyces sp. NPDC102437 TaxID=3366175 RepID=UPI0037F56349